MGMLKFWNQLRDHWWGQPIVLSLLMLPIAGWLSPRLMLPEGKVYLVYLPLAACFSLLMVYDWRALPGITLAIFIRYSGRSGFDITIIMTLLYMVCLGICWWGYRSLSQRFWCVGFSELKLSKYRLIWLVMLPSALFVFGLKLLIGLDLLPDELGMMPGNGINLHTLVNFQAVLIGCLSSMQLFYFVLRILKKPRFAKVLWGRIRREIAPGVKSSELQLWFAVLSLLVFVLSYHTADTNYLQVPDYSLTLLIPVMLYSAMRFGYQFNGIIWATTLIVLFFNYPGYVQWSNLLHNLTMISSMMLAFTLSILLTSAVHTRQRMDHAKAQSASLKDPVIGLPNLRALKRDLAKTPRSTLCFLRIAELDLLSRNYGMQLRIRFKQKLAGTLRTVLEEGEDVYHLPGYDLVLRLNGSNAEDKVAIIQSTLEKFRLVWNGLPIHPPLGISYCGVYSEVAHLHLLLGELSSLAEMSLTSGRPENIQNDHHVAQDEIKRKVALLHWVQRSLDNDSFVLMAQPIVGVRGDTYHEVLLRMLDDDDNIVPPNEFMPVVHEFGLAYQLDLWVLRHTLQFMAQNREALPSARFAVNLSPSSLCRPSLCQDVFDALRQNQIEPYQLVLEVTESHLVQDVKYAKNSLKELRQMGCRIALDDFGTGYATYARLKELDVDTLKIDGNFVRDMLTSKVDYQIISSICKVALMQRLSIVAEYVETEAQRDALKSLGVDYMQGYFIGKPQLLASLVQQPNEPEV
ncbi:MULTISPECIES: EAL domain-containing protein [unclassified Serratia (in: enterobacteria)]|uniref:sensor domain-containing phosphodiesterase n=1 Tax=unclassified Serratia (in: enterobacteria) TaxID=2647522 RepID=UPI000501EF4D|nr:MULTISPECIES: EAL domain-containing protein [unclassified Serratia (in: enterobacteria)]KFK96824.1 diguanylate cyclase [Serratia sp. Ag2]KFK97367.1 diguanylate cyclase [Serratia sp. Ag1]